MTFEIFNIFPTTVYIGEVENHVEYKKEFYKVYPKFDYEEDNGNVTVSENVGNPFIHLEEPIFKTFWILEKIIQTINFLN